MTIELIAIIVSLLVLLLVYGVRMKSRGNKGLFSESFSQRADEKIFEFVKFVFKLYSLLFQNVATFVSKIPHKLIHSIHFISHKIAQKSSEWVEKITHKHNK